MNKKGISIVIILCMMLSMLPMAAFAEDTDSTDVVAIIGDQTFTSLQAAVDVAITSSSAVEIVLQKDATVDKAVNLTKNDITVNGQGKYSITPSDSFTTKGSDDKATNGTLTIIYVNGAALTLKNVTVDANEKSRVIFADKGKLTIDGATITGGSVNNNYVAGVYMTNSASFEMNSGSIENNTIAGGEYADDHYLQYSSDLWIGANANGTMTAINGGKIGNVFVNANEYSKNNPGAFTLTGGTIDSLYVEYYKTYGGSFTYDGGTIGNLYLATKYLSNQGEECGHSVKVENAALGKYIGGDIIADGRTLVLQKDLAEDLVIPADTTITLDLNSQTLSNQSGNTITNEGTLTVIDSSTDAAGVVTGSALVLDNKGTATLEDATFNGTLKNAADATLTINSGRYNTQPDAAYATNGYEFTKENENSEYWIVTAKKVVAKIGEVGYPTLKEAVTAAKTDKATIKLTENVTEDITIAENQDITLEFGTYSLTGNISNGGALTINSGTFNGTVENIVDATNANLVINGGSFKPEPNKDYAAKGYKFVEDSKNAGYWILTKDKEDPVDPTPETVAKIGEEPYPSLQAAVEAAKAEDTITLAKNATENITIAKGKTITLALGKDYALNGEMTNDGTLTILSGTFHTSGSALVLDNNGTATLKDGTFNGELQNAEGAALNITGGKYAVDPTKVATNIPAGKEFTKGENETYWTLTDKKPDEPIVPEEPIIVPEPEIKVDTEGSDVKEEDVPKVLDAVESIKPAQNDTTITETVKDVEIPQEVKENAAKILADSGITVTENDTVSVVVAPYFDIQVKKYDAAVETANVLTLDITPKYVLKVTTATDPTDMNEHNTATVADSEKEMQVEKPITLTITLPEGFTANFVKHMKGAEDNYAVYYYPVNKLGTNNDISFTIKHGFSEFTFLTDERSAAIHFDQKIKVNDTEVTEITYTAEHVGDALPTPVKNDRFQGWKIEGTTYDHLTSDLWDAIAGKTVNATAQYSSSSGGSSGGSSSSSSGGPATSKAVVSSPDNDVKVTYTGVASSLINNVEKAVADNKNVQVVGGSNSAIKVSAKKGDTVLSSFDDPLTVTVPVIKSAVSSITSTSKLTLAKVNKAADGKITFTYMGGNYNEAKNNFTAYVDEPGEYVLLFDNNVQKIELQVGKKANTVNGRTVTNDVAPVIVNSRTMIPLRFVSESLGGQVSWTEATRAVTIKMNGLTMNMTIDQKIDGFDTAPVIRDGRTMVPVRYIAEKLGANVIYVPNTQEIVVVK